MAAAGQDASVGGKCQAIPRPVWPSSDTRCWPVVMIQIWIMLWVPPQTRTGVRCEADPIDFVVVSAPDMKELTGPGVPKADGPVLACGGEHPAIGGEGRAGAASRPMGRLHQEPDALRWPAGYWRASNPYE